MDTPHSNSRSSIVKTHRTFPTKQPRGHAKVTFNHTIIEIRSSLSSCICRKVFFPWCVRDYDMIWCIFFSNTKGAMEAQIQVDNLQRALNYIVICLTRRGKQIFLEHFPHVVIYSIELKKVWKTFDGKIIILGFLFQQWT